MIYISSNNSCIIVIRRFTLRCWSYMVAPLTLVALPRLLPSIGYLLMPLFAAPPAFEGLSCLLSRFFKASINDLVMAMTTIFKWPWQLSSNGRDNYLQMAMTAIFKWQWQLSSDGHDNYLQMAMTAIFKRPGSDHFIKLKKIKNSRVVATVRTSSFHERLS